LKLRSDIEVSGVFDIETESWDRFVCAGILADGRYREHRDEERCVDDLLSLSGTVWAHNGGRFDLLWFCDHIARRDLPATVGLSGSRIVKLQVGEATFRDSMALVPLALKDTAGIGGTTKLETGLRCDGHYVRELGIYEQCGGYCRIRRKGMTRAERSNLSEYLRQDCVALDLSLAALRVFAEKHDLDLCGTIGMSAWKTIQRWLDIDDAEWSSVKMYKLCREAYFGGRVQVFRPEAAKGWRYDINSAYPAALVETPIPHGAMRQRDVKSARRAYLRGVDGIYRAAVSVPGDCFIPPLPIRARERVAYPVGAFQGRWTGVELRYAEEKGASVEILDGITWAKSSPLLADFCKRIWGLRHDLGKKHPIGKWLKWFANSPTGKLAQRPEGERIRFLSSDESAPKLCPGDYDCAGDCGWRCCPHLCTRRCGGWRPLDRRHGVWRRSVWRLPASGYVHWAAYLTAATRVKLGRQLDGPDGGGSAVYCDTDSCYATAERTENIGEDLGQFNFEGYFRRFTAMGPKAYRYFDPVEKRWHVRAKGIPELDKEAWFDKGMTRPATEKRWERLAAHEPMTIKRGVDSFLQRGHDGEGFFKRRDFSRRIHENNGIFGDRELKLDGRTYPCHANRFR
jgi:hypothetical protein